MSGQSTWVAILGVTIVFVTLAASGAVQYDPADMATLYRRWSSVVSRSKD